MGTQVLSLSKLLFGQSRRSILALLYGHADEQFYLREIARRAGTGIGATQRELGQLTDAGLLHRLRRGNQVYYRANRENPIFEELKSILAKTSGIRDTLQEGLARLADRVKLAFVYGSIARGEEKASSDVDLMVVGNVSFQDVVAALSEIERKMGREVNPTVFGSREFREKLAAKNHFLSSVAKEKKVILSCELFAKFAGTEDGWIHLPAQFPFDLAEGGHHVLETHVAHDHQIHVARCLFLASRNRAVHKRKFNSVRQSSESFLQSVSYSGRLRENAFQFFENRILTIRAVINLVPAAKPVEKPGVRQLSEFSLRGSNPCSGATCNFAQIELFVSVAIEQGKDRPSALAEEDFR